MGCLPKIGLSVLSIVMIVVLQGEGLFIDVMIFFWVGMAPWIVDFGQAFSNSVRRGMGTPSGNFLANVPPGDRAAARKQLSDRVLSLFGEAFGLLPTDELGDVTNDSDDQNV